MTQQAPAQAGTGSGDRPDPPLQPRQQGAEHSEAATSKRASDLMGTYPIEPFKISAFISIYQYSGFKFICIYPNLICIYRDIICMHLSVISFFDIFCPSMEYLSRRSDKYKYIRMQTITGGKPKKVETDINKTCR
jgi:hypothetical protein